tara:strand:- start:7108 stop:7737 length:630 start_codon:yes stop_codon:yes gene_type:complete
MLIQQTIPKEYSLFTRIIHDSADKGYKNRRTQRVVYFGIDFGIFSELINDIFEKNKKSRFLIREEKRFLKYALEIFDSKKHYISFDDYVTLIQYSFDSVLCRLKRIKRELTGLIKNRKFEVSNIDNEYFFSLENILQQVEVLNKDLKLKDWFKRTDKLQLIGKILIIFKNINKLALSIALDDTESIPSISDSILSFDKIQFNISSKLVS